MNLKTTIMDFGASLVGFADLSSLPENRRMNMPRGIALGIALDSAVVARIPSGPHDDYCNEYENVNRRLDAMAQKTAELLISHGHQAVAQTLAFVKSHSDGENIPTSLLPHKTVATLAGLGYIGKNLLLITKEFGSAVRITSVLTDAAFACDLPQIENKCKSCRICTDICPGKAIKNTAWKAGMAREQCIVIAACDDAIQKRGKNAGHEHSASCGLCMAMCPHTRAYVKRSMQDDFE